MFTRESPFVGIDVDNCVTLTDDELVLSEFATELVGRFGTYAELSPSQTGLHLIVKAENLPAAKGQLKGNDIEVYSEGRYFTVTGHEWTDGAAIQERSKLTRELVASIKGDAVAKSAQVRADRQLTNALKDPWIKKLWDGDASDFGGDHSRADLALCSKLVKFCDGNREVLDSWFRQSKLFRPKWLESRGQKQYGELTLDKVFETNTVNSAAVMRKSSRRTVNSLWDDVMHYRKNGDARGFDTGWPGLSTFFRPYLGALTILLGIPSSGKSTFADCLSYNLAKQHGWKTTFASFETQPVYRHLLNLSQICLRRPTFTFIAGHASDTEMETARKFLHDHFFFLTPDDNSLDIESILTLVDDDIEEHGISQFILDPFTEISVERGFGENEVKSIERTLRRIQQFTRSREIHTGLLVHPTKTSDTYKKEIDGTMRPTLYSASGASHFKNKADFGLVIHRQENDLVRVYVDKVRNAGVVGDRGSVAFKYAPDRREYEEIVEGW